MNTFSFSSVLMTIFAGNVLLVVITLLFRNEKLLARIGCKVMALFCVITLARLLFPYELPFAKTVILPAKISEMLSVLRHQYELVPGVRISVTNALFVVWFVGSLFFMCKAVWKHMKLQRLIRRNSKDVTKLDPYNSILESLGSEKERGRLRLLLSPFADSPMIIGLFDPVILLPQSTNWTGDGLLLAIRHEFYHYRHHDLWLKFLTSCIAMVYWWNPFCRILDRRVGTLLEIRVDTSIISDGNDTAIEYVATLLEHMKGSGDRDDFSSQFMGLTFSNEDGLHHRIHMMANRNVKPNYLISVALLLLALGLYIGSYLVIFENASYIYFPEDSENYIFPEEFADDGYAIRNADGTYTVYLLNGRCTDVVESLEFYPGIVVYSSKEEYDETVQETQ